MSLCKFTLGVAAGFVGALLYDAYKRGEFSCCVSSCCRGENEEAEDIKHGFEPRAPEPHLRESHAPHAAEPLGDFAGR